MAETEVQEVAIREVAYWQDGYWVDMVPSSQQYKEWLRELGDKVAFNILRMRKQTTDEEVNAMIDDLLYGERKRMLWDRG